MYVQLEDRLAELQDLEVRVLEAWAERRAQYQEDLELQQLQRELEQAEHWLNTYESALKAEDYGVGKFLDFFYIFVGSIRLPLASKPASLNLTVLNLWTGLRFRCSGVDEEAGGSGGHDSSSE